MLAVLQTLGQLKREEKQDEEDKAGETKSKSKTGGGKKAAGPSFERIETVAAREGEGTSASDVAVLRVETLSGYGLAKDWALDLRTDLPLWSKGDVAWSDMSTRLLLSGPPGTGKTTFARALCNTLQLPLLATSVGRWLESSYLGDVLSSMAGTFEAAKAAAPCVLFIDEADNIGRRSSSSRDFGDYWNSIVNRMLELLDGASKTDGVIIVAATNSPEKIDPALLRSGRLERHIVIPPPDREALTGILRHHLGSDVTTVLATRPATSAGATEENAAWAKITPAAMAGAKPVHHKKQGPQA
ncbi:AAA family ATPase (plasmid) [Rhizobium sp. TH2]|uniref:AAA family ATPase n=1 Tax=Rhizobium sp. TH2 TaxID=2775403 RepID=UPI0021584837|nr:ATP-binding protein [Rhizobium sp. TH2]UVC12233.1 AAA family ATPase [Rhizobium sp. TH2]